MSNIESLLYVEIGDELEKLKDVEVGTDKHKVAVEDVAKLMDRAIEMERLSIDEQDKKAKLKQLDEDRKLKLKQLDDECNLKRKQMDEERKDQLRKDILTGAATLLTVGVTVWGTIKTLNFDKTDTITTSMGRGFISRLFPKK